MQCFKCNGLTRFILTASLKLFSNIYIYIWQSISIYAKATLLCVSASFSFTENSDGFVYLLILIPYYNLKPIPYQTHPLHNSTDFSVIPKPLIPEGLVLNRYIEVSYPFLTKFLILYGNCSAIFTSKHPRIISGNSVP